MRCIQLMDAEFNMTNKLFGPRALAHAEKANAISPDQYGSCKNDKSINAVLNKVLLNDVLRQKKRKGCYNRIFHSIAILVLMSFCVTGPIARALFKML